MHSAETKGNPLSEHDAVQGQGQEQRGVPAPRKWYFEDTLSLAACGGG